MITPQDVAKAEDTLTKLVDIFRAVSTLQDSISTIKYAVGEAANIAAERDKAAAKLEDLKAAIADATRGLEAARAEKANVEAAVVAIKGQLKGVRL